MFSNNLSYSQVLRGSEVRLSPHPRGDPGQRAGHAPGRAALHERGHLRAGEVVQDRQQRRALRLHPAVDLDLPGQLQ